MSIQSVQSSSYLLSQLTASSSTTSSTSSQNSFDSALANLFAAIQSGDTTGAQKYLAQVQKLESSTSNTTSGTTVESTSPLGKFLAAAATALSNNDISSAQSALKTLENTKPTGSTATVAQLAATSVELSDVAKGVLQLFNAIGSGNQSDAQSAYDSVSSQFYANSSSSSTSSTSDSFTTLLSQIGGALTSNDMTAAQAAMDSFLSSLSAGSMVNTSA